MEGSILEIDGATVLLEVPELGGSLKVISPNNLVLTIDQHVTVGIRPEYVQLRDQPGENTFLSTVDRIVEGITATNCYFHVNSVEVTRHYVMVILPRPDASEVCNGKTSYLYLPPEHVVIITD